MNMLLYVTHYAAPVKIRYVEYTSTVTFTWFLFKLKIRCWTISVFYSVIKHTSYDFLKYFTKTLIYLKWNPSYLIIYNPLNLNSCTLCIHENCIQFTILIFLFLCCFYCSYWNVSIYMYQNKAEFLNAI